MKGALNIFFTCFIFSGSVCAGQTISDSLPSSNDSLVVREPSPPVKKDSLAFQPQYQIGQFYFIRTNLDIRYKGVVIKETEYEVVIEDRRTHEKYELHKGEIKSSVIVTDKASAFDPVGENYHARNYLAASSAFLFEKETINITYHWFLLEDVDFGITENFAIAAHSIGPYPISLGAKFAFKLDATNYIGGSFFGFANLGNAGPQLLGYGGIARYTNGTSNNNFTVGGGVFSLNSDVLFATRPVPNTQFLNLFFSNLAYCSRLNEYLALNLEGWYFPQAEIGFAGAGLKLVKNDDICWTFGCFGLVNFAGNAVGFAYKAIPIPYLGLTQKF